MYFSNSLPCAPVLNQYQWYTGHELEKTVRARFHGAACVALLNLGKWSVCLEPVRQRSPVEWRWSLSIFASLLPASVIRNTPLYFADKLHQALQVRLTLLSPCFGT